MKTIKYFWVLYIISVCNTAVHAQSGIAKLNINYVASFPTGSFHQFISNPSYNGFDVSFLYGINNKFSVGFNTGFSDYYQKYPRQVYQTTEGGDISAVVSNSIQTIPLLLKVNYNFNTGRRLQPYVGVAAGGNIVFYQQLLGEFGSKQNMFKLEAQPEIGLYLPFKKHSEAGITLSGVYNIIPFNYGGLNNLNNVGIKLGISFPAKS